MSLNRKTVVGYVLILFIISNALLVTGCIKNTPNNKINTKIVSSETSITKSNEPLTNPPGIDFLAEVRAWHNLNSPPFPLDKINSRPLYVDKTNNQKYESLAKNELWKWEWRNVWRTNERNKTEWKGSWFLIPSTTPPNPKHIAPEQPYPDGPENLFIFRDMAITNREKPLYPFATVGGEVWYWNNEHWELGPEK